MKFRILELCRKHRLKQESGFTTNNKNLKDNNTLYSDEIFALQGIEELCISFDEKIAPKKFGTVDLIIDFIGDLRT